MIIAKNISKTYGEKIIIKNFSYSFNKGLYIIRGRSGSGKTTLLNILSKRDNNYKGEVCVKGGLISFSDKDNIVSKLTVKEHLKIFEKVNEKTIDFVFSLKEIMNKKINKISLGERQLLVLVLVLNSDEENIILDEPLSALSCENIKKTIKLLEAISDKKTIIISAHNEELFNSAKRINLSFKSKNNDVVLFAKERKEKEFKLKYLSIYFKRILFRKIFFVLSLLFSVTSFFFGE